MSPKVKELLVLSPRDAAAALVIKAMRPGLKCDQLELTRTKDNTDRQMDIWVTVDLKHCPVADWKYGGTSSFSYRRLLWSDVFGAGVLSLPIDVPSQTSDILAYLSAAYDIVFDDDDVVKRPVTLQKDGTFLLVASYRSWRWFGSISLRFTGTMPKVESLAVTVEPDYIQAELLSQVADPASAGYGPAMLALRRGNRLGFEGTRVWWPWVDVALGTSQRWVLDTVTPSPFNGGNATVIANIEVAKTPDNMNVGARPRKLILALDRNLCTNVRGVLTLYYSGLEATQ